MHSPRDRLVIFSLQAEVISCRYSDLRDVDRSAFEYLSKQHPLSILATEGKPPGQKVLVEMSQKVGRWPYAVGLGSAQKMRETWADNRLKTVAITTCALDGDGKRCMDVLKNSAMKLGRKNPGHSLYYRVKQGRMIRG